jgi:hypothetical protein
MAYEQQERKKPKAPIDWYQLALSAQCPAAPDQRSSMIFGVNNHNVTITVYTNDPNDKDNKQTNNGMIKTSMRIDVFLAFLAIFETVLKAKGPFKRIVTGVRWYNGKDKLETPWNDTDLFVNKDADGVMSLTLTSKKSQKITFGFIPKGYHETHYFKDEAGNLLPDGEVSMMYARGRMELLKKVVELEMFNKLLLTSRPDEYAPPVIRTFPGSNGGGGGNSSSAPQRSTPVRETATVDDDDDVPY